jgi:hypothetical protein
MSGVIPTLSYKTMLLTALLLVSGMLIKLHLTFVLHVNLALLCFPHFFCWAHMFPSLFSLLGIALSIKTHIYDMKTAGDSCQYPNILGMDLAIQLK